MLLTLLCLARISHRECQQHFQMLNYGRCMQFPPSHSKPHPEANITLKGEDEERK